MIPEADAGAARRDHSSGNVPSLTARRTMNAPVVSKETGAASMSMMLQLYPLAMLATSSGGAETASLQFGQAETGLASTIATRAASNACRHRMLRIDDLSQEEEDLKPPGDEDKKPHCTS